MRSIGEYIERFIAVAGPFGVPLVFLGFVVILVSVFLDHGREELWGALFLVIGAVFYKLDQPGGLFQAKSESTPDF